VSLPSIHHLLPLGYIYVLVAEPVTSLIIRSALEPSALMYPSLESSKPELNIKLAGGGVGEGVGDGVGLGVGEGVGDGVGLGVGEGGLDAIVPDVAMDTLTCCALRTI
jgi:hypothetical protein